MNNNETIHGKLLYEDPKEFVKSIRQWKIVVVSGTGFAFLGSIFFSIIIFITTYDKNDPLFDQIILLFFIVLMGLMGLVMLAMSIVSLIYYRWNAIRIYENGVELQRKKWIGFFKIKDVSEFANHLYVDTKDGKRHVVHYMNYPGADPKKVCKIIKNQLK